MRIVLAALALSAVASTPSPSTDVAVRVAPAQTRVSFASVHLALGDLRLQGDALVGDFEIRVPLFPYKDERGTVSLRMDDPLEDALRHGATFEGSACSRTTGQVNPVRCSVAPGGHVRIAVTTPSRTLTFASRYTIVRKG